MSATNSSGNRERRLRFGIMCNGTTFPAWQARCLQELLAQKNVIPSLLIIDADSLGSRPSWGYLKKLKNFQNWFWYFYRFFVVRPLSRARRPVDMGSTLMGVPSIICRVMRKGKFSRYFDEADIAEIRKHDLDFILRFGFNIIRGEILQAARLGVWSFHHGDEEKYRGGPPAFWEIYNGDSVTGAILQRLTDRLDSGIVLRKGFIKTIGYSYTRNRDTTYFASASWPAQVCIDIQNGNADYLDNPASRTSAPIFRAPSNFQMVLFVLKMIRNLLLAACRLPLYDHWNIGIVDNPISAFLTPRALPKIQWLPAPSRSKFIADPFAIRQGRDLHIIFEDYDYRISRGCISAMTIRGRSLSICKGVIDNPFHMSYPYLFEDENGIYCVPETCEAREVMLYKAKVFPKSWVKVATLIEDFAALDSTIFQHEGRWWLFATDEEDGPSYKLKAWHSRDLLGPWEPHIANPVKVDVRSARPAGTPFVHEGCLYRPAQDCSETYGGRIVINRVIRLTPTDFKEEAIATIEPDRNSPYPDCLHTISAVGNTTMIDGGRKEFSGKSLSVLIHKMRKIRIWVRAPLRRKP